MFVDSNTLLATKRFQKAGALITQLTIAVLTNALLRLIWLLLTDEQLDTIYEDFRLLEECRNRASTDSRYC